MNLCSRNSPYSLNCHVGAMLVFRMLCRITQSSDADCHTLHIFNHYMSDIAAFKRFDVILVSAAAASMDQKSGLICSVNICLIADNNGCVYAGKGCTALCIENMQRVQELSPIELVEMFVTVFCFLKDSSSVSQVLLDDFRAANGYVFLTEFLLKYVQFTSCVFL